MNPLTNMKNVLKLSEQDLQTSSKTSWHDQYKDSAWIFVGGLPYDLTEGDIICIFSQYGEIVNINLVRAKDTGKSKGFCFICYEDQRSTILAVDNFNGIKILNRTIRVDHVAEYKVPKEGKGTTEETKQLYKEGCAPKSVPKLVKVEPPVNDIRETIADQINGNIRLPARLPIYSIKEEKLEDSVTKKENKANKKKKEKKRKKKSKIFNSSSDYSSSAEEKHGNGQNLEHKSYKRSRSRSKDRDKHFNKDESHSSNNYKKESEAYVPKRYRK